MEPAPPKNTINLLAEVQRLEEMGQKAVDEWRAENNSSSAVFGSSSPELEDLSKMFDD